ncbi:MAG TPA: Ig-like domain-containing protein, partial [Candidatus Aphodoplasma excrementigallinarum]|nr:Ig-like domain-containing protein [Candidatus Aphodoplasma excrementigallinarum]
MKRQGRKLLSLVLALCMLMCMFPGVGMPVLAEEPAADYVMFSDDFENYGDAGTKLTEDNSKWDSTKGIGEAKKDFEVAADPKDSLNKVGKLWYDNSAGDSSGVMQITKTADRPFTEPVAFSGRVLMPEVPAGKLILKMQAGSKYQNVLYIRETNGQVRTGGTYKDDFGIAQENEWVYFTFVVAPNPDDWDNCSVTGYVSGGTGDSNSATTPANKTKKVTQQSVKFGNYNGTTNIKFWLEYTPDAEGTGTVYIDDIKVYQASAFTMEAVKTTNVGVSESVEIRFNHAADLTSFDLASDVTVSVDGGAPVNAEVIYDERQPDRFTLNFPSGLSADTNYVVTLDGEAKDVFGNSIYNAARFSTGEGGAPVYDEIEAITVGYDAPLTQELDKIEPITFTAATIPATNVDFNKVEWLVDDEVKMTGKTFSYEPEAELGDTVITARYADDHEVSDTCTISVIEPLPVPAEGITVLPESLELWLDYPLDITPRAWFEPEDATNKTVTWTSSDPEVATVDPDTGSVTMLKEGKTTITAKAADGGYTGSMELTVTAPLNRTEKDKLNLDPVASGESRIDLSDFIGLPESVGEAKIALWSGDKTVAYTITVDDSIVDDFVKWNAWNEGVSSEQLAKLDESLGAERAEKYHTAYGVPVTFFVPIQNYVPGQGDEGKTYTSNSGRWLEQIAAGHSVQSHSQYHIDGSVKNSTFTTAMHIEDCLRSKNTVNELTGASGNSCLTMAMAWSGGVQEIWRQFYIAVRGSSDGINPPGKINYNNVSSFSMNGGREPSHMLQMMENALNPESSTYGSWICLHSHGLDYTALENEELGGKKYTSDIFEYVYRDVLAPNMDKVWTGTFDAVAQYGQERDTAVLTVVENTSDKIVYTLTDEMDDTMFDHPLTVKFRVPDDWTQVSATQAQSGGAVTLPVTEKTVDDKRYVLVETVPDRGTVTLAPAGSVEPEPAETVELTASATGAGVVAISGGSTGASVTDEVELGAPVTLTATADANETFLFWVDAAGRILSREASYTLTPVSG